MNSDFVAMFGAFADSGVEYMVVGAHALGVYGSPRATGRTRDRADLEALGEA